MRPKSESKGKRIGSLLLLSLFALSFLSVLVFAPAPAHAFSQSLVSSHQSQVAGVPFTSFVVHQAAVGDLMQIQTACVSGSFTNNHHGIYAWGSKFGIFSILDNRSQTWSAGMPNVYSVTNETASTWYTQVATVGHTNITISFSGTVGHCDIYFEEWNTPSDYAVSNPAFVGISSICSPGTSGTLNSADCTPTTAQLGGNFGFPTNSIVTGFALFDCPANMTGGQSKVTFTGSLPTLAFSEICNSGLGPNLTHTVSSMQDWFYFASSQTEFPIFPVGGVKYDWGNQTQSDGIFESQSCTTYLFIPSTCNNWERAVTLLIMAYTTAGIASDINTLPSGLGCTSPNFASSSFLPRTTVFSYIFQTGPTGILTQNLGFWLDAASTRGSIPPGTHANVWMAFYQTASGNVVEPLPGNGGKLAIVPGSLTEWVINSSVNTVDFRKILQVQLNPNAWGSVSLMVNGTASAFNSVIMYNDPAAGGIPVFTGYRSYPPTGDMPSVISLDPTYVQALTNSYCFGASDLVPGMIVSKTNTINEITTSTTFICSTVGACLTVTHTVLSTSTTTQSVNDPNMSALNYWLIPLLVIFVPFALVMGVYTRAPNVDPAAVFPTAMATISLTGWLGFAWSAFVPITIPLAFTIVLIVDRWRQ